MKKCCFIIPYFGKFPNYFQLFLNSCSYNTDYNWIIFTDNNKYYQYPPNVRIIKTDFISFKNHIQSFFDFNIVLDQPHKLCDYKPAYGYLFEKYISEYMFWGYCDIDIIMGDLNSFITDDMLYNYDKIFCLGHMTLFKNTKENNRVFLHDFKGKSLHKISFMSQKTTTFDEEWRDENNINQLFISEGKNVFINDFSMNPAIKYNKFIRTQYVGINEAPLTHGYKNEQYKNAVYIWDKGHIYRYFLESENLVKEEYIYMHFQMRNMKVNKDILNKNIFKIIPNEFTILEFNNITKYNFSSIKKTGNCNQRMELLKRKINKKIKKITSCLKLA